MTLTASVASLSPVLRAETRKLHSLRAARWSALVAFLGVVGVGALVTLSAATRYPAQNYTWNPLDVINGSWTIGYLVFLVIGVVTVSNEHASGLITATCIAEPRRVRVLLSRALIVAVAVFVVAEVVSFLNFFLGHELIAISSHAPNAGLLSGNTLRTLFGEGLYASIDALFGLATAALFRNTAGSIAVVVWFQAVMPIVFSALPPSLSDNLLEYWPAHAGVQIAISAKEPHVLGPWWGFLEFSLFVAVLLVAACYLVTRRDPA